MKYRIFFIFMLFAAFLNAQTGIFNPVFAGADSLVLQFMKKWGIPGGAVAISKDGKLVYNRGFGFSDVRNQIEATPGTRFRIASVSKPITAIAVMKLVEEGRISLEDTVFGAGGILKQPYYLEKVSDSRIFDITVKQLLEHTAGWDRNYNFAGFGHNDPPFFPLYVSASENETGPVGDSTLIRFSLTAGLQHAPGKVFSYSNIGYLVLGKVIESASGMSYERYVRERIFSPLGIGSIELGKNLPDQRHPQESLYYGTGSMISCYGDEKRVPAQYGGFNLEAMNAHGGWIATPADLVRLLTALESSAENPVLSRASVARMTAPGDVNPYYASGWSVNPKQSWWHTGSIEGAAAFVARTAGGLTWSFLFNSRADNSAGFWRDLDRLPWDCTRDIPQAAGLPDLFSPVVNVSALYGAVMVSGTAMLRWQPGDGEGRIVVVSEQPFTGVPRDGQVYTSDEVYGQGSEIAPNAYVVYQGMGNSAVLQGLDPGRDYYLSAFEYRQDGTAGRGPVYCAAAAPGFKLRPVKPAM